MCLRTSGAAEILRVQAPYHPQCLPLPVFKVTATCSVLGHLISKLILSEPDQARMVWALLELELRLVWELDHRLHVLYSRTDGHVTELWRFSKVPEYLSGAKTAEDLLPECAQGRAACSVLSGTNASNRDCPKILSPSFLRKGSSLL